MQPFQVKFVIKGSSVNLLWDSSICLTPTHSMPPLLWTFNCLPQCLFMNRTNTYASKSYQESLRHRSHETSRENMRLRIFPVIKFDLIGWGLFETCVTWTWTFMFTFPISSLTSFPYNSIQMPYLQLTHEK